MTYLNGTELFTFNDSVAGKTFTVREASDEQLTKLLLSVEEQTQQVYQRFHEVQQAIMQSIGMAAAIRFEIERRSKSIVIAHRIN